MSFGSMPSSENENAARAEASIEMLTGARRDIGTSLGAPRRRSVDVTLARLRNLLPC